MRLTEIAVYSKTQELFSLNLERPNSSDRFVIKAMTGLDADEIIPRFYGFGSLDAAKFYQMNMNKREIVMRILLNPRWNMGETYSDVRDDLYRAISSTRDGLLSLLFKSSATTVASLNGSVTKFEVPHFSKTAEVQLTILCEDPLLRSVSSVEVDPADISGSTIVVSDASSTAPHGFEMTVTFSAAAGDFVIQDASTPNWIFKIDPAVGNDFASGDVLYISSEFGNKRVERTRSSVVSYMLDSVTPGSVWPVIFPGRNEFYLPGRVPTVKYSITSFKYKAAYWGV